MAGLLFILGFAVLLGAAQLIGLAVKSPGRHDDHTPPDHHLVPDAPTAAVTRLDEYRHCRPAA